MNERIWILAATIAYGVASALVLRRASSRLFRPNKWQIGAFLLGLAFHTQFLVARSSITGHCPISNLFEVLAFVLWSLALAYLVVGPLYRMTLLGALTAPAIFIALVLIQIFLPDTLNQPVRNLPRALELHASLSILAYGALGIAALTGLVYLIQERILKRKIFTAWLANLPSLSDLARVNRQLLIYGLVLLTGGLITGFFVPDARNAGKLIAFVIIWLIYGAISAASHFHYISPRKAAAASLVLYVLMISTFWNVNQVHTTG